MKSIIVKVQIQFDTFEENKDIEADLMDKLNEINEVLQERFPDISPQIFANNIDKHDIEVADYEDEE